MATGERLLVLLNTAYPSAADEAEAKLLLDRVDARELSELIDVNRVAALSLERMRVWGFDPARFGIAPKLIEQAAAVRERNAQRAAAATTFLKALHEQSIDVIVRKGFCFADAIYRDRGYKRMNDADILLRREDVERACDVFARLGYSALSEIFGKDELSDKTHHAPPYINADGTCVVGVHWGLVSPRGPFRPDMSGIWKRSVALSIADAPARRMSWEDNLLHLSVHLPFFKIGLRELADHYNVVLQPDGFDWILFDRLVAEAGAEDAAYRLVGLTNAVRDLRMPRAMFERWKALATPFTRADTDARLLHPDGILRARSVHIGDIEKAYIVFRKSGSFDERLEAYLRMYRLWLSPPEAEMAKLSTRPYPSRIEVAAKIWSAMARDHGHLPLLLMTAANALSLGKAAVRRAFGHDGEPFSSQPFAKVLAVLE